MKEITENISLFIEKLTSLIQSYDIIIDTLDIALVAFLIFNAIKMLRQTRGIQIVKGLVLVGVVFGVISLLHMQASTFLFKTLLSDFILVLIILFAPEIRHALETMGRSKLGFFNFFGAQQGDALYERKKRAILEICKACNDMSEKKIGALIVFERDTQLGDVVKTGTTVEAKVSKELIGSLFFPNSPLHDGAVVIRDGRVLSAGCILPLTENNRLSSELGTRHRASLGITENSDAVVVVVSEETGKISISVEGKMERDISDGILIERLMGYILPNTNDMVKNSLPALIKSKIKEKRNK
ncbi:MAG: diadenylate cyclase CdaA [Clostridia bacterium]|nr:diadenylate cyclase CdaA [Clostridia bacterium]